MKKNIAICLIALFVFLPVVFAAKEKEEMVSDTYFAPVLFPMGDIEAGKEAFKKLDCVKCHAVKYHPDLPKPTADALGPVLGDLRVEAPIGWLIDSIVSPSHSVRLGYKGGPTSEHASKMVDYTETMTVRELIDIVTFLKYSKDQ